MNCRCAPVKKIGLLSARCLAWKLQQFGPSKKWMCSIYNSNNVSVNTEKDQLSSALYDFMPLRTVIHDHYHLVSMENGKINQLVRWLWWFSLIFLSNNDDFQAFVADDHMVNGKCWPSGPVKYTEQCPGLVRRREPSGKILGEPVQGEVSSGKRRTSSFFWWWTLRNHKLSEKTLCLSKACQRHIIILWKVIMVPTYPNYR